MAVEQKILEILEKDSSITAAQIAVMLDLPLIQVQEIIDRLEEDNTIVAYKAVVNWEKTEKQAVTAFIEIKASPQHGAGFEKIAERISKYPEVQSVFLMSGSYDIAVIMEGKTLADVSNFVWERLAVMESVVSTATHFVLKKYKEDGVALFPEPADERGFSFI